MQKRWSRQAIIILPIAACAAAIGVGVGYGVFGPHVEKQPTFADQVKEYQGIVDNITDFVVKGSFKGRFYRKLAHFVDTFGPRFIGSESLSKAIDFAVREMQLEGLDNVHTHEVPFPAPKWVRGEEHATMISPRLKKVAVLGLGYTAETPETGLVASAIVVRDYDELETVGKQGLVTGKIVVLAPPWKNYGYNVQFRSGGDVRAKEYGGVAVLMRSASSFSVNNPHTGATSRLPGANRTVLPYAAITAEDANLFYRLQQENVTIILNLTLRSRLEESEPLKNTIAQITGSKKPQEVIVVSGHMDSWDVGEGAMDDGAGVFLAWMTLSVLKEMGLRPRRTIRAVYWTAEETGGYGASKYYDDYRIGGLLNKNGSEKHIMMMESDHGVFKPGGLNFLPASNATMSNVSVELLGAVMSLLKSIKTTQLALASHPPGSDISRWCRDGIACAEDLHADPERMGEYYFVFHHSEADTMDVLNSDDMDLSLAMWTAVAYVVADFD